MAELLFKRGLHSALPASSDIVDGAFYLTTDSHRLYAGIGSELVDLNQYIHIADSVSQLNGLVASGAVHTGDFAYATKENVLAIKLEGFSEWQQINPDTTVEDFVITGDLNIDDRTTTVTFTLDVNDQGEQKTQDLIFVGKAGIGVKTRQLEDASGSPILDSDNHPITQLLIEGNTYAIGEDFSEPTGTYKITLTPSRENGDDVVATEITLKAGENIIFSQGVQDGDPLVITAKDTTLIDGDKGGTFTADDKGGAAVYIEDTEGNVAAAIAPDGTFYYKVGKDSKRTIANQNELPVYTIDEIDRMMTALNPMSYKGIINSEAQLKALTDIRNGDTYMVSAPFELVDLTIEGASSLKVGDLLIAVGPEDADGILTTVTWTYVPSGDDAQRDTTYVAYVDTVNKSLIIEDDQGQAMTELAFTNTDNKLTLTAETFSATELNKMRLTINHAAPGTDDATKKATDTDQQQTSAIIAVTGIEVDETGHVAKYTLTKHEILTYKLNKEIIVEEDRNYISVTTQMEDGLGNIVGESIVYFDATASDNLHLTVAPTDDGKHDKIVMKLEWGSF